MTDAPRPAARIEVRLTLDSTRTTEVFTAGGRRLAVEVTGADRGLPVFLLHGTPGSRRGPKPRSSVLYRQDVRLISYDRPGYGGSDPHEGRRVVDAAHDVMAIANALGLNEFSVVGRSGGGPHALACMAVLGNRVARAAVLVGLAPADANGLDWFGGMVDSNIGEYAAASSDLRTLTERLRLRAHRTANNPDSLVETLLSEMTDPDRRIVSGVAIRRLLTDSYTEAVKAGPYGWIDDVLALRQPWGFDLGRIAIPVRLWHGAEDNFTPASHTRWLASQIPSAEVQVQLNTAHFGAVEVLPEMLAWLTSTSHGLVSQTEHH